MRIIALHKLVCFYHKDPSKENHLKTWYYDVIDYNWKKAEDVINMTKYAEVRNGNLIIFNSFNYIIITKFIPTYQILIIIDIVTPIEFESSNISNLKKTNLNFFKYLRYHFTLRFKKRISTETEYINILNKLYTLKSKNLTENMFSLISEYENLNWKISPPDPIESIKVRMLLK